MISARRPSSTTRLLSTFTEVNICPGGSDTQDREGDLPVVGRFCSNGPGPATPGANRKMTVSSSFASASTIRDDKQAKTNLPTRTLHPTGEFRHGSKDHYSPEYLLDHGIILVTINYRLGVLGKCGRRASFRGDLLLAARWIASAERRGRGRRRRRGRKADSERGQARAQATSLLNSSSRAR